MFQTDTVVNHRYRIVRILGAGGMGTVYQTRDEHRAGRLVAMKVFRGDPTRAERLRMFGREFLILSRLRHPNIATAYDFAFDAETHTCLFTMEWVDGTNIVERASGADWETVLSLLVQVCRALSYVHGQGFVHGDLKPGNVMVTHSGEVKLLDFGIALSVRDSEAMRGGTRPYLAPELLAGAQTPVSPRADLFALGVMGHEFLSGILPEGVRPGEVAHSSKPRPRDTTGSRRPAEAPDRITGEETTSRRSRGDVPDWLLRLLDRLCEARPEDRLESADKIIDVIAAETGRSWPGAPTGSTLTRCSRFVGRDVELELLSTFMESRARRRGEHSSVYFVSGPSGIGKTRLLDELHVAAQFGGLSFFSSRCFDDQIDDHDPVAQVMGPVARLAELSGNEDLLEEARADLRRLCPGLGLATGKVPAAVTGDPQEQRRFLLHRLSALVIGLANRVPLGICFDDLHWAHAFTTDFIDHLVSAIAEWEDEHEPVPVALIGGYRSDEVEGRALERLLEKLLAADEHPVMILRPQSRAHVQEMMSSITGVDNPPSNLVDRIVEETGGNPFFVEETLRVLLDSGKVRMKSGEWELCDEVGELEVPGRRKVLRRRVSFLAGSQRALLEMLALSSRPLSRTVVHHMLESDDELDVALDALLAKTMIDEAIAEETSFDLHHAQMRETLCTGLSEERRRLYHGRIGQAIEAAYKGRLDNHLDELAFQFLRAGQTDKAIDYSLRGGRRAEERHLYDSAVKLYSQAIQLMDTADTDAATLLDLHEKVGDCCTIRARYDEALSNYLEAEKHTTDRLVCARLRRKLGGVYDERDDLPRGIEILWEAIELAGGTRPAHHAPALGHLFRELAIHLTYRALPFRPKIGGLERRRLTELAADYHELSRMHFRSSPESLLLSVLQAGNLTERLGPSRYSSSAYSGLALLYCTASLFGTARAYCDRAVRMSRELGLVWSEARAYMLMGLIRAMAGEWDRALAMLDKAATLASKHGHMNMQSMCKFFEMSVHIYEGDIHKALDCARQGSKLARRVTGPHFFERSFAHAEAMFGAYWVPSTASSARAAIARAGEAAEQADDQLFLTLAWLNYGELCLFTGRVDEAIANLEKSIQLQETARLAFDWSIPAHARLAQARLERARLDRCEGRTITEKEWASIRLRIGASLRCTSRRHERHRCQALMVHAAYEWARGRCRRARAIFARARMLGARQGRRLCLAEIWYEEGRCLLQTGELAQARECLEEARQRFTRCGARLQLARAAGAFEEAGLCARTQPLTD